MCVALPTHWCPQEESPMEPPCSWVQKMTPSFDLSMAAHVRDECSLQTHMTWWLLWTAPPVRDIVLATNKAPCFLSKCTWTHRAAVRARQQTTYQRPTLIMDMSGLAQVKDVCQSLHREHTAFSGPRLPAQPCMGKANDDFLLLPKVI